MPNSLGRVAAGPTLLIIVDQREFVRGCLNAWLGTFGQEFEVRSTADVSTSLQTEVLARASVVIFSVGSARCEEWLQGQFAWLLANRADVPIVMIAEADQTRSLEALAGRLRLRGYIPTSSSIEVAAAVLHLIVAGGIYLPRIWDADRQLTQMLSDEVHPAPDPASAMNLTPRERAVLELLQQGMANKIIAHRLSMSQSTVKAHVHNIIVKLKVRNRTEAAVMAHYAQPVAPIIDHGEPVAAAPSARVMSLKRQPRSTLIDADYGAALCTVRPLRDDVPRGA